MRLNRFIAIASFITFFSLLYTYQQTEIFRLAYIGQKRTGQFQDLLDKNSLLRYNINKSTSLVYIANNIDQRASLEMPQTYRLVRLVSPQTGLRVARSGLGKGSLLARFFSVKRQAEAKTINPQK